MFMHASACVVLFALPFFCGRVVLLHISPNAHFVGEVDDAALDEAAGRVEVDPEQEAQEGPLQVVVDRRVVEDGDQVVHAEDGLAHGLDKPVLSLCRAKEKGKLVFIAYQGINICHTNQMCGQELGICWGVCVGF